MDQESFKPAADKQCPVRHRPVEWCISMRSRRRLLSNVKFAGQADAAALSVMPRSAFVKSYGETRLPIVYCLCVKLSVRISCKASSEKAMNSFSKAREGSELLGFSEL